MGGLYLWGKELAATRFMNLAIASATVGAFLGMRPMVRITMLWLLLWLVLKIAQQLRGSRLSPIAPLWLATLGHIIFWKDLAKLLSW
jgi:hypothetical protein